MKQSTSLVVVTLLVVCLMASACQNLTLIAESASSPNLRPRWVITATDQGWETTSTIASGWTDITLINQSNAPHQSALMRISGNKTPSDVLAALASSYGHLPEWLSQVGGPVGAFPGDSLTISTYLEPGDYVLVDPIPGPDGLVNIANGYFMPILVEASDSVPSQPEADLTLKLADYAFIFDQSAVTAGQHTIEVRNQGPQEAHEVVIIRLNDGVTVQDFLANLDPSSGPPPGHVVAGVAPFGEDVVNYMDVEFEAGATYGLLCAAPSTEHDGQPHFMLGMIGQFTVPE